MQIQGEAGGAAAPRPDVPMPVGVRVFRRSNGLMITRRWLSAKFVFLLVFACLWDGFMVLWFGITMATGMWLMAAAGTLHAAIGVGITYAAVAGFVNTTTITALQGLLEVRHSPLPWFGNRRIEARQLAQLYSKRRVHHSRNGTTIVYELRAQSRDGKDFRLVEVDREDQALFIERQLEEFLGIKDQPVPGEVERP